MNQYNHQLTGAEFYTPIPFSFSGPDGRVEGLDGRCLPRGTGADLAVRLAGVSGLIGGALPFERQGQDYLWQAGRVLHDAAPAPVMPDFSFSSIQAEPAPQVYAASVTQALRAMDADASLRKVVLARTLAVTADQPLPQDAIFGRLAQDGSVTAFRVMLPDDTAGSGRALIGATPELLVSKTGGSVISHPLAGSARRQADPVADRAAHDWLAGSDKDWREHAIVVEYILDTLTPYCRDLTCPEGTTITSTGSMWHLGTRITGRLRDGDMPSVLLASALHPTPAVCGLPCDRAAALIRQAEPVDRQFYAGAVGWTDLDRQGDGAWYVAIRCADICGAQARLYAGAGIVPGSDPAEETTETGAKFGAMLQVLGLPADTALNKD
ncbi:isochorismate synthase [Paracoccus sp. (in: a-proteobacteria)]|uniref:isochorismate synthase n=1 Tax=Paracoccus sp. TaxID=267 RepID=UPI002AFE048F|nr:isochorismate synthase [Paracoccus sp. (in: a-proteobacteria)]